MHGRKEGNFIRRSKRMFHLSNVCDELVSELALYWGVTRSAVIEMSVRRFYRGTHGKWPIITDQGVYHERNSKDL
jgi:hypothetical protein